jgi:hypothetical protein
MTLQLFWDASSIIPDKERLGYVSPVEYRKQQQIIFLKCA